MISWADSARKLQLGHGSFAIQGIVEYAAAATKVSSLRLNCSDTLEAAQADDVLSKLRSVRHLMILGFCFPGILPTTVTILTFWGLSRCAGRSLDAAAADAFIWRARNLPDLRILTLVFPDTDPVKLTSSVLLSTLQILNLQMHISCRSPSGLCFDWVHRQPVRALTVDISICDAPQSQRAALLQHIAALKTTELSLKVCLDQETLSRLDQVL